MGRKKKEIQKYFSVSSRRKERPRSEREKNTLYCQGGRESTMIRMMYLKMHGSSYQQATVLQGL